MATNEVLNIPVVTVAASHPTTPLSGQPCRVGSLTGVALNNEDADGKVVMDCREKSWNLSVKGVDDDGNSAVAIGQNLYYVDADIDDGTGFLSKKESGRFFGIALGAVSSGQTATIEVLHIAGLGPGALDIGEVIGTAELEDEAVTFAKAAVFVSTEQTGTGSAQNVAHGLGDEPSAVLIVVTEHPGTPDTGAFDVAEGAHTSTNVVVTVTADVKFKVLAWL
jgi:hypothetical protein